MLMLHKNLNNAQIGVLQQKDKNYFIKNIEKTEENLVLTLTENAAESIVVEDLEIYNLHDNSEILTIFYDDKIIESTVDSVLETVSELIITLKIVKESNDF